MVRCLSIACLTLVALPFGCTGGGETAVVDRESDEVTELPEAAPLRTRHRLNKDELRNAYRDLLHVRSEVVETIPLEAEAGGFRNIASELEISSLLVDKLAAAAIEVARAALADVRPTVEAAELHYEPEYQGWEEGYRLPSQFQLPMGSPSWAWFSEVEQVLEIEARGGGAYKIAVNASRPGIEHGGAASLEVTVDGQPVATLVVDRGPRDPKLFFIELELDSGTHDLGMRLTEGAHPAPAGSFGDPAHPTVPAIAVDHVHLIGPLAEGVDGLSPREALVTCDPVDSSVADCGRQILMPLAERAWRRPVSEAEITEVVALVEQAVEAGLGFDAGLEYGIRRLLLSPHFVFKLELHDHTEEGEVIRAPHPWQAHELASRLSFFLWAAAPDEVLWDCANSGALLVADGGPCSLAVQAARMLEDPRSEALITGWAYQWLTLREMEDVFKQWSLFPGFTLAVSEDMIEETVHVMDDFVHGEQPLTDLAVMDWTWMNNRLAEYYGLPLPGSDQLIPVTIDSEQRTSLITHGSLMSLTSGEHKTSPVKRAVWLLDTFLCTNVGPPPANVPDLDEEAALANPIGALAQHGSPGCRSCHDVLDPLGLALENYDAAGAWRDQHASGVPILVDFHTPDGRQLRGPQDIGPWIRDSEEFPRCLISKVGSYATGVANLHLTQPAALDELTTEITADSLSFGSIAQHVVHHPLFHHLAEGTLDE
jgi:hypothetical protein